MTKNINKSARGKADLVYAATMLKNIARSGFAFLGTGQESIAEHSFGAAFIAYILAHMADANKEKAVLLCIFHDLHEAATGDFNYVNHRYDRCDAAKAVQDISSNSGLEEIIMNYHVEFEEKQTLEAKIAHDADQLDLICSLRRAQMTGNPNGAKWLISAQKRIITEVGKNLCAAIMQVDPDHWWYDQVDPEWWVNRDQSAVNP